MLKTVSEGVIDIGETNIKNACVNLIKYDGDMFRVEMYNSPELP